MGFSFLGNKQLKRHFAQPIGMALVTFAAIQTIAQAPLSGSSSHVFFQRNQLNESSPFSLGWNTSLTASDAFEERISRNTGFEWVLSLEGRYAFNDNFRFKVRPNIKIQNGYVFGSDASDKNTSKLSLSEANFGLENSNSKILIGVVPTGNINNTIGANKSYAGFQADYLANLQYFKIGPLGQTYLLSGGSSDENSKSSLLPSFSFGGIKLESYFLALDTKFTAQHGLFQYRNLNSDLAQKSEALGSTVTQRSINESEFAYAFKGTESTLSMVFKNQSSIEASLKYNLVNNLEAPQEHNKAQTITVGLSSMLFSNQILSWEGSRFIIESDAFPASENNLSLGNNRLGFTNTIAWTNTSQEWRLKLSQSKANPIEENLNQDQMTSTSIIWETLHATL